MRCISGGECVVSGGERYRVGDIWESGDGCRRTVCRCATQPDGKARAQCHAHCPPLPEQLVSTPQCPRPRIVTPEGNCECPYVACEDARQQHGEHDSSRYERTH